jgi:hypothetical protein
MEISMKYMLLIYGDETRFSRMAAKEQGEAIAAFQAYTHALSSSGALLSRDRLQPVAAATTVRASGGDFQMMDGPFAETKEQLGGYYLIEAADLDAALKWAKQCPGVKYGAVEVRPVQEMSQS